MRQDTALYTAYTALFRFLFAAAMSGLAMSGIAKPVSAQMVHVITVADIHSDLSDFVEGDVWRFSEVMTDGLGENRINRVYMSENNTPQNILNTLHHLENVGANDAVVFYYTGHGAWDKQKGLYYSITSPADAAPNFQPEPERNGIMKNTNLQTRHLLKSDVVEAIQKHRPRLTVVISDCCSSHGQYIPSEAMATEGAGAERIKP
ncbi:MAG: caspase family protein, partial [Planctomycetaceae bacterium]|nr:caspase family protein [Planctomycetaceae bacterium]